METGATVSLFVVAAFLTLLLLKPAWLKSQTRDFAEALQDSIDRFRGGGPPSPMHPSPANDAELLRRRARRSTSSNDSE